MTRRLSNKLFLLRGSLTNCFSRLSNTLRLSMKTAWAGPSRLAGTAACFFKRLAFLICRRLRLFADQLACREKPIKMMREEGNKYRERVGRNFSTQLLIRSSFSGEYVRFNRGRSTVFSPWAIDGRVPHLLHNAAFVGYEQQIHHSELVPFSLEAILDASSHRNLFAVASHAPVD